MNFTSCSFDCPFFSSFSPVEIRIERVCVCVGEKVVVLEWIRNENRRSFRGLEF